MLGIRGLLPFPLPPVVAVVELSEGFFGIRSAEEQAAAEERAAIREDERVFMAPEGKIIVNNYAKFIFTYHIYCIQCTCFIWQFKALHVLTNLALVRHTVKVADFKSAISCPSSK